MRIRSLAAAAALSAALAGPATASAEVPNSFDVFNQQSLNANGGEPESPTGFSQTFSREYDTRDYTWDPQFESAERPRTGCVGGGGARFGSRTAWVRFTPAVKGRLAVSASTGYDVMLFAYRTRLPRGAKGFGDSEEELRTITCSDASTSGGELPMVVPSSDVIPGRTILLQTATFCGTTVEQCQGNERDGGQTALTVQFTADDADGDGVPDTSDGCLNTPGERPGGCPPADSDSDGIPDRDDRCQFQRGVAPTGCPADTDGDGVANENDACIFERGTNPNGCPDPDGDSVLNEKDQCPFVAGIAADGCPDSDGDGVSDRADKCRATPGNGADGCPKPLGARVPYRYQGFAAFTRFSTLQVKAPKGAKVELRCIGRGCKVKRKRFTQKRATQSLLRYLPKGGRLRKGIVLEVRVTAPLTLGSFARIKVRGLVAPKETLRCIRRNGKLQKCP